jgi:hypothetical protein
LSTLGDLSENRYTRGDNQPADDGQHGFAV